MVVVQQQPQLARQQPQPLLVLDQVQQQLVQPPLLLNQRPLNQLLQYQPQPLLQADLPQQRPLQPRLLTANQLLQYQPQLLLQPLLQ
jgi:hypothetical protein